MNNPSDLEQAREEIDKKIAQERKDTVTRVMAEIRKVMKTFNLTRDDLYEEFGRPPSIQKGRKIPPKYRNPKTGATWSGRGSTPLWLVGQNKDDFKI